MADDPGTKSIVDMALGASTTVAFAFGPVGVGIAAAIAVGKFLFDLFYDSGGLTDPMAQAPDKADLQNGLDKLRDEIDDDLFDDFDRTYKARLFAASDALNNAIRAAGTAPKAGLTMPGPTVVWSGGQTDALFQPVANNPGIFADTISWLEQNPSHRFATAPIYALTIGLHLLYLKTALVWEVNENLRDYETRKATWDKAQKTYATQLATWQAMGANPATRPAKPTDPEPQPPTGGDWAVGSEVRDAQGTIFDVKSHLGKVSSKWAIATRDLLNDKDAKGNAIGPIAWMQKTLDDYDAAVATKNQTIAKRLALVMDVPMPNIHNLANPLVTVWIDGKANQVGTMIDHPGFRALQSDIWKEGLAGNMDQPARKAASLDKLTADDAAKLRKALANWRKTLTMYQDALKTLDDGPINPSTV